VLAHTGPQVDDACPDVAGARGTRFENYGFELVPAIREPGEDRRDADANMDSGVG
jgi:hypothetical protein